MEKPSMAGERVPAAATRQDAGPDASDIANWSLAHTRILEARSVNTGSFVTEIIFAGRHVLSAVSPGDDCPVVYCRADNADAWDELLRQACRRWLSGLGLPSADIGHEREVWLDWKVFAEPQGIGEHRLAMSLSESLAATSLPGSDIDWALMEEVFGPFEA